MQILRTSHTGSMAVDRRSQTEHREMTSMKINIKTVVFFFLCTVYGILSTEAASRPPAVAGQFYPDDPKELAAFVDNCLDSVPSITLKGEPVALLVPHAGYIYSAQTAAYAFILLENSGIENVILIGNSHSMLLNKGAVMSEGSFKTPLGEARINTALAKKIISNTPYLEENPKPHMPEHSLEVELPFLQRTLAKFTIVPVLLSDMSPARCEEIGKSIGKAVAELGLNKKTVIIASSDMSHYPTDADARVSDSAILKALGSFEADALFSENSLLMKKQTPNLACTLCGLESVAAAMHAAKYLGATSVQILNYSNSGAAAGDGSRVVGYGAAVFFRPGKTITTIQKGTAMPSEFRVSEAAQKELLKIARESIEKYLKTGEEPSYSITDKELSAPGAVFVTLTKKGALRGCIGTTVAQMPLYKAVSQLAIAAAVEDTRFQQVTPVELKELHIEISVLSPLTRVKSHEEIIPGKTGVVVRKGFKSGLFLPQVWEQLPSKEEFMSELCWQKAGLDPNAWKTGDVELYIFTVFAFEESK